MDTRSIVGVLIGLVGVAGAASVLLSHKTMKPPAKSDGKTAGGVPLAVEGQVSVGMVSSIPKAVGYDTGPLDMTYNPSGWDYAAIGLKA